MDSRRRLCPIVIAALLLGLALYVASIGPASYFFREGAAWEVWLAADAVYAPLTRMSPPWYYDAMSSYCRLFDPNLYLFHHRAAVENLKELGREMRRRQTSP